jgi:hypothetical protein
MLDTKVPEMEIWSTPHFIKYEKGRISINLNKRLSVKQITIEPINIARG